MQRIQETITKRFSCRSYLDEPLPAHLVSTINALLADVPAGPFGNRGRFVLLAAGEHDNQTLNALGTYGFIQGANAYVAGAITDAPMALEDFGWQMELLILRATELGLGTCWLGGSFTRSTFAQKINARIGELLPAIFSVGIIKDESAARQGLLRKHISADDRLACERLFFEGAFGTPYAPGDGDQVQAALEMVRRGPSASNKQPWRVVVAGKTLHFYLERTRGYHEGIVQRFLGVEDLQRLDMGIAMCHFELAASELGLQGSWQKQDPGIALPNALCSYTASWAIDQ